MFRELKLKLIMINVISLTIVLIIIFSGLYFMINHGINKQAYMIMNSIAKEERIIPQIEDRDTNKVRLGSFFIKLNALGEIIEYSPELSISKEDVLELKETVQKKEISYGNVENNNYRLKFLKVQKGYGFILVFIDNSMEFNFLKWFIIASTCIGLISLTMVFIISFFLANKAIMPVKTSWEKQNAFVADASHELRTPLAVVTSNLEIVMENENETVGSQNKWLDNVYGELERMKKLVDDLLFLARSDAKDEEMYKEPFDLSGLLYKIYDIFIPLAQKKGLELILYNKDGITGFGNEFRIKQLITILLDNAIKNTKSGGKVELRLDTCADALQLSVKDTGEGIAKEHLDRIFDRFYRIDKSRSRSHGGTGLGLAIAKCIATEHKGSINVLSEVGLGTEFKVTFPIEIGK